MLCGGGLDGSLEPKDSDLLCPVCFELIQEAYVTRCGHSFCFQCIAKAVEVHRRCPKCGAALSREQVFPNTLVGALVSRARARMSPPAGSLPGTTRASRLPQLPHLPLAELDAVLVALQRRKRALQADSEASQLRLTREFLSALLRRREEQLEQLQREAALVREDLDTVGRELKEAELRGGTEREPTPTEEPEESFVGAALPPIRETGWSTLSAHFDEFVSCYLAHRAPALYFPPSTESPNPPNTLNSNAPTIAPTPQASTTSLDNLSQACNASTSSNTNNETLPQNSSSSLDLYPQTREASKGLELFRNDLVAFTRYRALRPLATLSYSSDAINYSTIVSTIEFDKDEEFFAIAGVTKRIKVFEYAAVVMDAVDVHYPCAEMSCAHKVSCLSWNCYHKHVLASADYEGTVGLWDASTQQRTRALQEHDKRCWSVHFSRADVRLLASGSDDARVKLWALNTERSVATLEAKFNVCCVRFSPRSSCHLAFGSADHCVHYYDLRSPRQPLAVFRDHKKAVSYVKFLDAKTLVSASTDSQLKLWNVDSPRCVRSFTGHANEKNFVGLATDGSGKYIACGSENNALYIYYSGMAKPLLAYKFDAVRGFLERERRDDEPSEFVSAVCWRRTPSVTDQQVLLAANSQGTIKVLELV